VSLNNLQLPIFFSRKYRFTSSFFFLIFERYGFDLYLNGHAHSLTQYTIDYTGYYMTTGAGSLVNTASQSYEKTARKVNGESFVSPSSSHSYQTVWNSKTAGFSSHTFDATFTKLTTQFISYTGTVLHSFTITK
jgi:hypothetical protein